MEWSINKALLQGYEIREYLLEKWNHACAYCERSNLRLEVDHIIPKSCGGTNRLSNLVLACQSCNQQKGNLSVKEFVKDSKKLECLLKQLQVPLKDAAAVNTIHYEIGRHLQSLNLPLSFYSAGRTKFNRAKQGYSKDHWIDAICCGETGEKVIIPKSLAPLLITATGLGSRQMCRLDQYGFPRTSAKSLRQVGGFKTGDIIKANVLQGKKQGSYTGRVAIRSSGFFNITAHGKTIQGIHKRYCKHLHRSDGYYYAFTKQTCP